jgi:DNA-binding NtrC family response regulator
MAEAPVVLVVATQRSLVEKLVQDLRAHGLISFGTTSADDSVRSVSLLQPEVVVIDPSSDECSALLSNCDTSSRSLRLVAIAESEEAAERSREMGIDEVLMGDDAVGVVEAVLNLVDQRHASLKRGEGPPRVLIVDDEPDILKLLAEALTTRGYDVRLASSGDEALDVVEREDSINMVLLDVILPGKSGVETLKELKERHPQLAVILMSAVADSRVADRARRLGAFDYILKPLDYDKLELLLFRISL